MATAIAMEQCDQLLLFDEKLMDGKITIWVVGHCLSILGSDEFGVCDEYIMCVSW